MPRTSVAVPCCQPLTSPEDSDEGRDTTCLLGRQATAAHPGHLVCSCRSHLVHHHFVRPGHVRVAGALVCTVMRALRA